MFFPALAAPLGLRQPCRRGSRTPAQILDEMLTAQIARRRATGTDGYDDVLSVLLSESDGARDDAEVLQQLRTLLVSGHETSATTLAWALFHIHTDDVVREALHAELAENTDMETLSKLPYLGAVIAETLRLHPTVSIVVRQLKAPQRPWGVERVTRGRDRDCPARASFGPPRLARSAPLRSAAIPDSQTRTHRVLAVRLRPSPLSGFGFRRPRARHRAGSHFARSGVGAR